MGMVTMVRFSSSVDSRCLIVFMLGNPPKGGAVVKKIFANVAIVAGLSCVFASCTKSATSTPVSSSVVTRPIALPTTSLASTPNTTSTTTGVVDVPHEVLLAYRATYDKYWSCLHAPGVCDVAVFTARSGTARVRLASAVGHLNNANQHVEAGVAGYMVVESVRVDGSARRLMCCPVGGTRGSSLGLLRRLGVLTPWSMI